MGAVRRGLDGLYDAAGLLAAACMVAMLGVIVAQMAARWFSVPFPGSSEYAGYLMASSAFLAFAHALNRGAHIRVNILLNALGPRRRIGEIWCMAVGSAVSAYVAFYAVKLVYWSRMLDDISQGQDEMRLWLVQAPFAAGAVLLAVCFADNLVTLLAAGRDNIRPATDGAPVE
jgi:TRAP-type C4-dicarboxylate transport system permease small subunit